MAAADADCKGCADVVHLELTWPDRDASRPRNCGICGQRRRVVVLELDFDPRTLVRGAALPRAATVRLSPAPA